MKNGDESDVDCGGSCPPCGDAKGCLQNGDCRSLVCLGGQCAAPRCTDGVKNGSETDVDCGGADCAPCPATHACLLNGDCASGACVGNRCATPQGSACDGTTTCATGHCVDGVCCNTACGGACTQCNAAGQLGTCVNAAAGAPDPHLLCTAAAASTCGNAGVCSGAGSCAVYSSSTVCQAASCTAGTATLASHCDGAGTCTSGGSTSCGLYTCNAAGDACRTTCSVDAECAAAAGPCQAVACVAGQCQATNLPVGTVIANPVPGDCHTDQCDGAGHVVTGVVDNSDLPASAGQCTTPVCLAGTPGQAPKAAGTACNSSGGTVCDGAGSCVQCVVNADCTSGACQGNVCVTLAQGSACASNASCTSGFCVDGFCCGSACAGACQACSAAKTGGVNGVCAAIPNGQDPDNECASTAATSCGTTGVCNGAGACALYPASTACAAQSCTGSTHTFPAFCTGTGSCPAAAVESCAPYVCSSNGVSCLATCTTPADCLAPATCTGGTCQ